MRDQHTGLHPYLTKESVDKTLTILSVEQGDLMLRGWPKYCFQTRIVILKT